MYPSRLLLLSVVVLGPFFPSLCLEKHCAPASVQLKQKKKSLLEICLVCFVVFCFFPWLCASVMDPVLGGWEFGEPYHKRKSKTFCARSVFSKVFVLFVHSLLWVSAFLNKVLQWPKGRYGIKPEDGRAGPWQIKSNLVVISLIMQVELGDAGSFICN